MSFKRFFSRSLSADPSRLHFAAHSHHLWPDACFAGQERALEDAARLADRKWDRIFTEVWPQAQAYVAGTLNLSDPKSVTFAPNTHDLLVRVLSGLSLARPLRILTTDGEFHSFRRQLDRLEEEGLVSAQRVSPQPFADFAQRFAAALQQQRFDVVFLSQVFYQSGFVVPELERLVAAIPEETLVIVDGYHGFLAVPTDWRALERRAFYMSGGYKYAMSGEGVCFLHAPPGVVMRPRITGWFAAFGALAGKQSGVPFAEDCGRFLGATFDPSGIYRFVSVMDWLERERIDVAVIRRHTDPLARAFAQAVDAAKLPFSSRDLLLEPSSPQRGQFLTYAFADAHAVHGVLEAANIITDVRDSRLRFGFGIYQDAEDVAQVVARMQALAFS
jgi:kynureninase